MCCWDVRWSRIYNFLYRKPLLQINTSFIKVTIKFLCCSCWDNEKKRAAPNESFICSVNHKQNSWNCKSVHRKCTLTHVVGIDIYRYVFVCIYISKPWAFGLLLDMIIYAKLRKTSKSFSLLSTLTFGAGSGAVWCLVFVEFAVKII